MADIVTIACGACGHEWEIPNADAEMPCPMCHVTAVYRDPDVPRGVAAQETEIDATDGPVAVQEEAEAVEA